MKRIYRNVAIALAFIVVFDVAIWTQTPAKSPAPPTIHEVTPKESVETVKLQLALEKQKSIQLQAQLVQKSIDPLLAPLQQQYNEQEAAIKAQEEAIRKENGWGPEVSIDRNPQSSSYGKFIKTEPAPPKK